MFSLYSLDQRHWKRWQSIAGSYQQLLTEQQIADGNPGTILTDPDLQGHPRRLAWGRRGDLARNRRAAGRIAGYAGRSDSRGLQVG
jgi:hypothetical protein